MKLTLKLILAAVTGIGLVLGVATWKDVQDEREALIEDAAQDHGFFARTMGSFARSVWEAHGQEETVAMLGRANAMDRAFDTTLVSVGGPTNGVAAPVLPPHDVAPVLAGRDVTRIDRGNVYSYAPLQVAGRNDLAVQVVEPLTDQERFLRAATEHAVRSGFLVALACALVIVLLGLVLVGAPIRELVRAVRRIGQGELGEPVRVSQRDEIGDLAREIDAMRRSLADAREAAAREASMRVEALEALRHADRLRTVGQLASSLAHELGTPIQVIVGRARLVEQDGTTPVAAREHAKAIVEQSGRMSALIRSLLDFARARAPQKREVDVRDIVSDATRMLGPLARQRGVTFRVSAPSTAVPAVADPSQITQALTNLLVNAVQAMPKGGDVDVRLQIADATPPPELQSPTAPHVEISVSDRGVGIRRDVLPKLFEPFFTTKSEDEGTGLGLSVAHGIVRDHGGFIDVDSEPGKGATFRIWLPTTAAVHAATTTTRGESPSSAG